MSASTDRTPSPRPPIGLLLRRLDGLITERFEQTLGARGVTRRQWQLLNTLAEGPGRAVPLGVLTAAVAPFLDEAAGETAGPHLAPLVDSGCIRERPDGYTLTDSGRELHEVLSHEVRATRERTVDGIAAEAYDQVVDTLQTMIRNLDSTP